MGKYSVPQSIREKKPKGTMAKNINDHYYVYEHSCQKDENGKWKTVMGKNIGSITEELGFIPNNNFLVDDEVTTLEYGQYAIAFYNSQDVLNELQEIFNPMDAIQIYLMGLIHVVTGFVPLKDIKEYFSQSWFSIKYPEVKMGYQALSTLLDSLGRKQTKVQLFEQNLLNHSSKELAFDGHVIRSTSDYNDLADFGNKYRLLKERQVNLMMAYDLVTGKPILSKMYDGSQLDKTSITDMLGSFQYENTLFVIDRGFYSKTNITAFSSNGNHYIIPLAQNLKNYKDVVEDLTFDKRFVYERSRKKSIIEYKETFLSDGKTKVIVYRNINENAIECDNYLKHLAEGEDGFSQEEYERISPFFGVIVLQSNLEKSAQEIYQKYKGRWQIETFYNYFKNDINYNALGLQDYYMTQGLSFIMLISGLIHQSLKVATKSIPESINDCLLSGRFIKIHKKYGKWQASNVKKKMAELFSTLGVELNDIQ